MAKGVTVYSRIKKYNQTWNDNKIYYRAKVNGIKTTQTEMYTKMFSHVLDAVSRGLIVTYYEEREPPGHQVFASATINHNLPQTKQANKPKNKRKKRR